ncbi:MAG TPA: hypothetical protein VFV78_08335 [Vicinamibacterales bacterium]|nr:hypothetical protein [Vicinamibacterales bacterium]
MRRRRLRGRPVVVIVASALALGFGGTAAIQKPVVKACSLLTKDLALKVTSAPNTKVFDLMPPEEETVGAGSACEYGDIRIQLDAFDAAKLDQIVKADQTWTAVPGVGSRAWFHNNKNRYAELMAVTGTHTLLIQMGVPIGGTAEGIKPKAITLANALLQKLK